MSERKCGHVAAYGEYTVVYTTLDILLSQTQLPNPNYIPWERKTFILFLELEGNAGTQPRLVPLEGEYRPREGM